MAASDPKKGGLLESARRVGHSFTALLANRLQLFAIELQEEKYRALQAAMWLIAGLALLFLGLAMGVGAVGILVFTQWGIPGLCGLTVLLLALGGSVLVVMWNRLKSAERPFAGTLRELKKDCEWLQRKS